MTAPVPRLNLAPKLRRPLSLWNPFDYLRLLYWVFFFPQALRWYVDTFGGGYISLKEMNWEKGWEVLEQYPIQRQLLIQGLILIFVIPLTLGLILNGLNVPFDWSGVMFWVAMSVAFGVAGSVVFGVAGGVAFGVAGSVVFSVARSLVVGVVEGMAKGVAFGVAFGVAEGVLFGVASGLLGGVLLGVAGVSLAVALSVTLGMAGVALGVAQVVVQGVLQGVAQIAVQVVVQGVLQGVAQSVANLRPETWFFGSLLNLRLNNDSWLIPRITPIPLPNLTHRLENWLQQDWETGLDNANELLAYSVQFIPVIQAVNKVLAATPSEQIISRVSLLAKSPCNWNLVRFASTSLDASLKSEFIDSFFIMPRSWRERWQTSLFTDTCLDTPAHAAAAGFWYLYKKQPTKAQEAFAVVRSLLYGEEMYILAQTLAIFHNAKEIATIATLQIPAFPKEPLLRPNTWTVLNSLRRLIEDIQFVNKSVSRSARSFALNRALGELRSIISTLENLPQAERGLVMDITVIWGESLLEIAGEVGKISITKPVINPYIIGDPVQGNLFVGREDVLRQLEELWVMGNQLQSVVLYGHRRMGKTSILLNASQCLGSGIQLAYVNLLRLGDSPQGVGEVLMAISDEISQTVKLAPPNDTDLLNLPYRTFERYLKQVEAQLEAGLIIALDEFEKIEELIEAEKIPPDFMGYLRGLVQMSSKIAFAFAGLHTLEEMTADYFQPFFASVIPINIKFIERGATRVLLANPNEDFLLDYTPEALDEIYALTHGQPYLVQLVGFQLVRRYNDQVFEQGRPRDSVFTIDDVETVINNPEFFQRGRYYFDGVWGQAAQDVDGQQDILKVLAPHVEGLSFDALAQSTGIESNNLQAALDTLKRHDVVEDTEGGWRIMVELFRRWVVQWCQLNK